MKKKKGNKNNLNKENILKYMLIFVSIVAVLYFLINRQKIMFSLGNEFLGGKFTYNVDLAQKLYLGSILSGNKDVIWSNYQLSRTYFIQGDFTNAIIYANKELENFPENCRTHYIRGLAYGYAGMMEPAITDFEKFIQCFPDEWAGYNDLAWLWFRQGNMDKVIEVIEKISYKYPYNPWLMNMYGTALMNKGEYERALEALQKAKYSADKMTEEDWGKSYPGNNSKIYQYGLTSMRNIIDANIEHIKSKK